jgi:trigger factor
MKIERTEKDLLVDQISMTLEPGDYLPLVEQQIKKLKKTVAIPGFRVGFAPEALIRKYYGKSVLVDAVDRLINDHILKYLEENQITTLGRPLESENAHSYFNPEKNENYVFYFDIAKAPEIDAKLSGDIKLTYKNITLTDEMFENQLNDLLTRNGRSEDVDKAGPDVMIHAEIREMENGAIKEDGINVKKYIFFNKLPENVQKKFMELALGSSLDILAGEIFPEESERNYILNLKNNNEGIDTSSIPLRITPEKYLIWRKAELNQEFFDRIYGRDVVKSEEEFKEKFRNELLNNLSKESDYLFANEVKNKLLEYFELPLPDNFLKRWLKTVIEKPLTAEQLEKEYPAFARSTRWDLIVNAIAKRYSLNVSNEELENHVKNLVINYFINQNIPIIDEYVDKSVKNIMEDQNKLRDYIQDVLEMKIVALCKEHCNVTYEELKEEEVKS